MSQQIGIVLFCFCLLLSWAKSSFHLAARGRAMVYTRKVGHVARIPWSWRIPLLIVLSLGVAALIIAFGLGIQRRWVGVAIVLAIGSLRHVETRQWTGDTVLRLGKYVPAAASLTGYLLVYGLTRDEKSAWEAACGIPGAAYFVSALYKVYDSGRKWLQPGHIALLVAERAMQGVRVLAGLRMAVVARPWLCTLTAWYGWSIEFLAIGMAVSLLRWPVVIGLTVMQLMTALVLGYVELEWILLPIALGLLTLGF